MRSDSRILCVIKSGMIQIDDDILEKCKKGDKSAFREVVKSYQKLLFSLSFKMLRSEDEAKDVVQETFIKVWQHIDSYDNTRKFTTWIYTIATRLCLDRLKAVKNVLQVSDNVEIIREFADDASKTLENSELADVINALVADLSPKQQAVFTLVCLENLETSEVEKITGLSPDKIKSNLYVARQTIRQKLNKLGYE